MGGGGRGPLSPVTLLGVTFVFWGISGVEIGAGVRNRTEKKSSYYDNIPSLMLGFNHELI